MRLVTAAEMRECDRRTMEEIGLPGIVLMESAGRGALQALWEALESRGMEPRVQRYAVYVGSGNNGGDGLVVARELLHRGCVVDVLLLGKLERYKGDAATNLRVLQAVLDQELAPGFGGLHLWGDALDDGDDIHDLLAEAPLADVVIDALFGTGLSAPLRSPMAEVVEHINASGAFVLAIDIPSGVSSDDGQLLGSAVRADLTAAFAFAKVGHALFPGRLLSGRVVVVDIGISPGMARAVGARTEALTRDGAVARLPDRPVTAHKGTFGHVLALGGAQGKGGALAMAGAAALRAGAGLVTAAGAPSVGPVLTALQPELMSETLLPDDGAALGIDALDALFFGKTVLAVGPGLGRSDAAREALAAALQTALPLVLDADALNLIADSDEAAARLVEAAQGGRDVVLTPHPGEFARLTGLPAAEAAAQPLAAARAFASASGCVVVLKGAATVVARPDGAAAINSSGNPGMASAGMGDVLTGVIAGLLAQGLDAWDAACLGVFLHGMAGDVAAERVNGRALTATDVIQALGEAFQRCEG